MNDVATLVRAIPRMSESAIEKVSRLEEFNLQHRQENIPTRHVFHAGIYSRTIMIPKGVWLTGAYIIIPTLLVVSGHALVFSDDTWIEVAGYQVMPARAGRKQAFIALENTDLTMNFSTTAKTVESAEEEFTNEAHRLMSRRPDAENFVIFTGD